MSWYLTNYGSETVIASGFKYPKDAMRFIAEEMNCRITMIDKQDGNWFIKAYPATSNNPFYLSIKPTENAQ